MDAEPLRAKPKQKRGRERVEAILNAASELFAQVGYEQTTTIEIAARADTSVGSLYQFFANKESILRALVERYVERASAVFAAMEVENYPNLTLEQGIRATLIPLKAFLRDNQDFRAIFSSSIGPGLVAETIRAMDEAFMARNDAALALARPNLTPHQRRKYSLVCMMVMKGLIALVEPSGELTLDEVFEEMEAVFVRYLTPIVGE